MKRIERQQRSWSPPRSWSPRSSEVVMTTTSVVTRSVAKITQTSRPGLGVVRRVLRPKGNGTRPLETSRDKSSWKWSEHHLFGLRKMVIFIYTVCFHHPYTGVHDLSAALFPATCSHRKRGRKRLLRGVNRSNMKQSSQEKGLLMTSSCTFKVTNTPHLPSKKDTQNIQKNHLKAVIQ